MEVTLNDWLGLAVGMGGLLIAYLARKNLLPKAAQRWKQRIGEDRILSAIEQAATLVEASPEERRKAAVVALQRLTRNELGFEVPTSIANLLVEFIYQRFRRR